ncbi:MULTISPECIES: hypothetical protein [unclassified Fusibacter]|uniref:hypothetical protein n=1 Tax=unclassified Fusibacter TaxID=2624464 RepID=UPI00101179D2|nr:MULTISPECIES: hypothetical protein [unclassified Fusibacter]MCK8058985.1 hypothetical protein [Fusibacter sp. A2]NPE22396.1 hypothetical protein [Fusibacter sp. A1]RXV60503.1 hypothetical protein DWB64_11160 [Fusibacter sp. A1]
MFRLWGKIVKKNNIIADHTFELCAENLSSKERLNRGIEALCYHFDIQNPMWLSDNTRDIALIGKTSFKEHHYTEEIYFDYFEIEIIEDHE